MGVGEQKISLEELSILVAQTIQRCAVRFRDPETRMPPNYLLSFLLADRVLGGYYLPILNQWGQTEYDKLIWGMGEFVLPWTHDDTWRWLTEAPENDKAPLDRTLKTNGQWESWIEGIRAGQIIFTNRSDYLPWVNTEKRSGGTRQGLELLAKKMRRPWQPEFLRHPKPKECPFCTETYNIKNASYKLVLLSPKYTPFKWHSLIVPTRECVQLMTCPRRPKTPDYYFLYTPNFLVEAFEMALRWAPERPDALKPARFGIHIGPLAGQNMPHIHFHLLQS